MGETNNKSKKILIVEDDKSLNELYAHKLSLEGFTVFSAMDGIEGLSVAMTNKPDLILLDIIMPELDGFEVLTKLRGNTKTADIPVLLLTNLSQPEQIERGKALGATDYLVKANYVPSELVKKIQELFQQLS